VTYKAKGYVFGSDMTLKTIATQFNEECENKQRLIVAVQDSVIAIAWCFTALLLDKEFKPGYSARSG